MKQHTKNILQKKYIYENTDSLYKMLGKYNYILMTPKKQMSEFIPLEDLLLKYKNTDNDTEINKIISYIDNHSMTYENKVGGCNMFNIILYIYF
jgi:hypothetical protein